MKVSFSRVAIIFGSRSIVWKWSTFSSLSCGSLNSHEIA